MAGVYGKPLQTKKVPKGLLEAPEDDMITLLIY